MFARAVVWGGGDKNQIDVVSLHGGVVVVAYAGGDKWCQHLDT